MRLSGSKGTSKNTSKSKKWVEKVRRIEVTYVDETRSNEGCSGGDTERIIYQQPPMTSDRSGHVKITQLISQVDYLTFQEEQKPEPPSYSS